MTALTQPPIAAIRPEIRLLLCCARTQIDDQTAHHLKTLLQQNLDWGYLLQTAAHHGVIPLLYRSLNATAPDAVPQPTLALLRNSYQINAFRALSQTQALFKLLELFQTHQIPAIPFKGPVLAVSVYKNLALRQFGDLDLLIRKQDVLKAQELLIAQGYQLQKNLGWESHFIGPDRLVNIDLHQAIANDFFGLPFDFAYFQSRLDAIAINHQVLPTVSPEDLLLILGVNFGKDCSHWRVRLSQLCDLAEFLRVHPQINWSWVISEVQRLGCKRMLLLELLVVQELFREPLPEIILKELQADHVVRGLALKIHQQIWQQQTPEWIGFLKSQNHVFYLRMRERFRDKVSYVFLLIYMVLHDAFIPNKKDTDLIRFPETLSFLYYPFHWIRILIKYSIRLESNKHFEP